MKKGDLVKYNSHRKSSLNEFLGIILSERDDGFDVVWMYHGSFFGPRWYSFRDLVPLTLDSSKDLLSKAL